MEGTHTFTEEQLRNAGASAMFVAYYINASCDATARREVEQGPFTLEELNANPRIAGAFFAALWNGNESAARRRADRNNTAILDAIKA